MTKTYSDPDEIEKRIVALLARRGPEKSFCPSEIARQMVEDGGDWRSLMPDVHAAARRLRQRGDIAFSQCGRLLSVDEEPRGAYRVRQAPNNRL
jgi:Protein of unknown function (DUF3253)